MADVIYRVQVEGLDISIKNVNDMDTALKDLLKTFHSINVVEAERRGKVAGQIQDVMKLKSVYSDWNQTLHNSATSVNQAGMTLQGLNYVVRDSPYFFQNMNLGIMAVGNNINPLIDSFIRLRLQAVAMSQETGQVVTAFGLLKQQLTGAGGVMLAFSLLVTVFQAVSFAMAKNNRETKDATETTKDYREELMLLKGTLEQLASTESGHDAIRQAEISSVKLMIEQYDKLIERYKAGGASQDVVSDLMIKRWVQQRRLLELEGTNTISETTELYKKHFNAIIEAAPRGGKAILDYAKQVGLTQSQLDNLMSAFKEMDKTVFSLKGGLGANIDSTLKNLAIELELKPEDVRKALDAWKLFQDSLSKVVKEKAPKHRMAKQGGAGLGGLFDIDPIALADEWRKQVDAAFVEYDKRRGIMRPKVVPQKTGIEYIIGDIEQAQATFQMITNVANVAGNAVSNAFLSGKNAIDAATQALKQFIVQLLVVQTIKGVLNELTGGVGGFIGGFLKFANGGYLPQAENGLVVGGSSYSGDGILARVNSGEMILNPRQQASLFKQINNGGNKVQRIEVYGQLKANKNTFAAEVTTAQRNYDKRVKVGTVGRS